MDLPDYLREYAQSVRTMTGQFVADASGVLRADNRYRYNGKEEQSGFGLPYLDYGARLYDPATGRWVTQDPLSEKYYGISPYAFCAGNPMKYVDADGMDIWEIDSEGYIRWREASEGHRLYSMTSDGYRSQDYITVRNRSIPVSVPGKM